MIKCLSLWQPWATLMAIGAKRIETRSWRTTYRGWIAIHAAKHWSYQTQLICAQEPFCRALGTVVRIGSSVTRRPTGGPIMPLPLGAIVAIVHLTNCVQSHRCNRPDGPEQDFGDFTSGRFQWHTDRVINLGHESIFVPGARGLFALPLDIERRLAQRIEASQ